jgi:cytochrome c556
MNRLIRIGVAATLAAISVTSFSQGGPPNQDKTAIETRQGVFKLINNQNGPISAMFRPNSTVAFDAALVARNAERIKVLASMIPELFTRDTRQFKDSPTRALDGIWASQADFKAKADALVAAAEGLEKAAKTGDKAATSTANGEIGKACGGCHDPFRAK